MNNIQNNVRNVQQENEQFVFKLNHKKCELPDCSFWM